MKCLSRFPVQVCVLDEFGSVKHRLPNSLPPPPGQRISQLRSSSHEDVVLSLLLRPSGPEALPELLSERDAGVFG